MNDLSWRGQAIPQVVLGCAQLGVKYGIANDTGKPPFEVAKSLVQSAIQGGFSYFDTAQAYESSESILGEIFFQMGRCLEVKVITKIHPTADLQRGHEIRQSVLDSRRKLCIQQLWGLMLHRASPLLNGNFGTLQKVIRPLREEGTFRYFGVSVSTPEEALLALDFADVDFLQFPSNAWDYRYEAAGVFRKAEDVGKLCFIRSVYLQGLLTMDPSRIRAKLPIAYKSARKWEKICRGLSLAQPEAAVRFALQWKSPLVIGTKDPQHFQEIVQWTARGAMESDDRQRIRDLFSHNQAPALLNPALWTVES